MGLERSVVSENLEQSKLGLIAGFVLSAMVIVGGIFLIYLGHDWAGGILNQHKSGRSSRCIRIRDSFSSRSTQREARKARRKGRYES